MACREIDKRWEPNGYIIKKIKWEDALLKASFPDNISASILQNIFEETKLNKITQQAIIQQYNEIYIYNEADIEERNILAPQVKITYDIVGLPEIVYPKFTPLIKAEEVWKLNEEDLKIYLGTRLQRFCISFYEYKKFINKVVDLCENFNLREDDILLNPSNIGYNSVLGLRIIDYGLTEDNNLIV